MSKTLKNMTDQGYTIEDVVFPKPISHGVMYYVSAKFKSNFEKMRAYVCKKDGKLILITEEPE